MCANVRNSATTRVNRGEKSNSLPLINTDYADKIRSKGTGYSRAPTVGGHGELAWSKAVKMLLRRYTNSHRILRGLHLTLYLVSRLRSQATSLLQSSQIVKDPNFKLSRCKILRPTLGPQLRCARLGVKSGFTSTDTSSIAGRISRVKRCRRYGVVTTALRCRERASTLEAWLIGKSK
jgi:hypothetical protein